MPFEIKNRKEDSFCFGNVNFRRITNFFIPMKMIYCIFEVEKNFYFGKIISFYPKITLKNTNKTNVFKIKKVIEKNETNSFYDYYVKMDSIHKLGQEAIDFSIYL